MKLSFSDTVKQWEGEGGWFYVRLPKDTYGDLHEIGQSMGRGFGAIKVSVQTGKTTWDTSIFPDSKDESYILFLKKSVRQAESLDVGSKSTFELTLA